MTRLMEDTNIEQRSAVAVLIQVAVLTGEYDHAVATEPKWRRSSRDGIAECEQRGWITLDSRRDPDRSLWWLTGAGRQALRDVVPL